jgi:hypothetical protein
MGGRRAVESPHFVLVIVALVGRDPENPACSSYTLMFPAGRVELTDPVRAAGSAPRIVGNLVFESPPPGAPWLAVSVNGSIEAVVRAAQRADDGRFMLLAMLPEETLLPDRFELQVFHIAGSVALPRLASSSSFGQRIIVYWDRPFEEPEPIRALVTTPLILGYMLVLVVAAWPAEIRPSQLDAFSKWSFDTLAEAGLLAGMQVFRGEAERMKKLVLFECVVVDGIDRSGELVRLHPLEPCPAEGFRWKPEIFHHMILHWTKKLRPGSNPGNLRALSDYFCHLTPDGDFLYVQIMREVEYLNYETGRKKLRSQLVGRIECATGMAWEPGVSVE